MSGNTKRKPVQYSRLLRSLLDQIPDSVYFKDENNEFVTVSRSKAEHLGVEPGEVVGKTDYDFYPEEQAEEMAEDDRRVMEEEESVTNKIEKVTRPDGTEHWVSTTKVPRYDDDGNVIGSLGVSRDLTELRALLKRREALSKKTLTD